MRVAAIDIGTNSTKMTVADIDNHGGRVAIVEEVSEITRLGAGVDAGGIIQSSEYAATLAVVLRFSERARQLGAARIAAIGTSALRDASNGSAFVHSVRDKSGITIETISGDREAELAYAAVAGDTTLKLPEGSSVLVFDTGGGSTELVLGQGHNVGRHRSLQIGAVRLTERYLKDDPPSDQQITEAFQHAEQLLQGFPMLDAPLAIVGLGGTAVNVAAVVAARGPSSGEDLHGNIVTADQVAEALSVFRGVRLDERRRIPGLESKRADIIIGGVVIIAAILTHFHAPQLRVSTRGVRFGLLLETAGL